MQRLFIAIEFPEEVLEQLRHIQNHLRRIAQRGRYSPVENLHLTVQFLGDTAAEQVPGLIASLHRVARQRAGFSLNVGMPGVFGKGNPYRVVWLSLGGELAPLRQLQTDVAKAVAGLGFAGEHEAYRPHITLARDVTFDERGWQNWIGGQKSGSAFPVQRFTLMESRPQAGKRIYRALEHFYFS